MDYPQDKVIPQGYGKGSKREQVERMFDTIAPTYDRLNHTMSLGTDRRWRRKAIDCLKPYNPRHILDVATGTGDFALLAYKELKPLSLTGIDISEGMMEVAREKARAERLQYSIVFKREDCTSLSFPRETFDAVTVAFGIRNFEELDKALAEMGRVLKPGGRLVILELTTPDRFPMRQLYSLYARLVMPLIGKYVSKDRSAYTYLPQSIRAFPQGEVMQESIRRAGFSEVSFRRLTFGICTLYIGKK